mmetsp:Transcript_42123/g.80588  ORF Transcript_42123/g.80588 Transcript_42123/m.80588 type:complete len:222 (+) Transcript_42123:854-1519(+)
MKYEDFPALGSLPPQARLTVLAFASLRGLAPPTTFWLPSRLFENFLSGGVLITGVEVARGSTTGSVFWLPLHCCVSFSLNASGVNSFKSSFFHSIISWAFFSATCCSAALRSRFSFSIRLRSRSILRPISSAWSELSALPSASLLARYSVWRSLSAVLGRWRWNVSCSCEPSSSATVPDACGSTTQCMLRNTASASSRSLLLAVRIQLSMFLLASAVISFP